MPAALTISRFPIPQDKLRECEPLIGELPAAAQGAPGFLSTSVWRDVNSPDEFMRLTIFESEESMDAFYDGILKSDRLVEQIRAYGIVPDVTRMEVDKFQGFDPKKVHSSEFMSFSLRALDPGMGDDWVAKMGNNFAEIQYIPGFEGAMISSDMEIDERVAGFAFWQTADSFRKSVPDNPGYEIDLYKLYR